MDVLRFLFCRLLLSAFGLGVLFGRSRTGNGIDPDARRRFRRRLREALDELLAEEPKPGSADA